MVGLILSLAAPGRTTWADPLLLDVAVNGRPLGKLGEFQSRPDGLYATRRELGELGLRPGPGSPDELVAVAALPGVTARLDRARQVADLTATDAALQPVRLGDAPVPAPDLPVESGWGGVLNYDLLGTLAAGRPSAQALLDARAFSPVGVLSSQALLNAGAGSERAVRLDSGYTYADAETLRRVRVGDVISSGLAWTRPLRLGGAQVARDFALRPDLVTIPVPTIAGQVAVPSSVDVLVNGAQALSAPAAPGPFELPQLPVVNGVNDVSVVVRDALGQQVTRTVAFYTGTALLAPGLDAYSVEAGAVRLGFGVRSNDYRAPAATASYRRGLTDWLTVSGHAEGSSAPGMGGLGMGGVGAAVALGSLAVASVAVAGSASAGGKSVGGGGRSVGPGRGGGLLFYGAAERITRTLSLSASIQWTDGRFGDLASLYGDPVPRRAVRVSAGYSFGRFGTAALAYTRQRRDVVGPTVLYGNGSSYAGPSNGVGLPGGLAGPAFFLPTRTSLLTASYSVPLPIAGASFYATAFHDFDDRAGNGALFGISLPLGDRGAAAVGAGQNNGGASASVQVNRAVVAVGDAGGQLYATGGRDARVLADAQYKSPAALLEAGAFHARGGTAWRAGATGSLVLAGGDLFAANAVADSFAVVDTGHEGVDVLYENRLVQRTGPSGRVLVPDLRSFEVNRLSIDGDALPFDAEPGATARLVRPADRSGVLVRFAAGTPAHPVLVRLVDAAGQSVPVGSTARLEGSSMVVPVGFGGEAYFRDVPPQVRLLVETPGRPACHAAFTYQPRPGDIPVVANLRCVP